LCGAAAGEDDGPHLVAETPSRHAGQEVRANVLSAIVTRPFLTRHELIQATDLSHDAANTAVAALLQVIGEPGTQLTMRSSTLAA